MSRMQPKATKQWRNAIKESCAAAPRQHKQAQSGVTSSIARMYAVRSRSLSMTPVWLQLLMQKRVSRKQ